MFHLVLLFLFLRSGTCSLQVNNEDQLLGNMKCCLNKIINTYLQFTRTLVVITQKDSSFVLGSTLKRMKTPLRHLRTQTEIQWGKAIETQSSISCTESEDVDFLFFVDEAQHLPYLLNKIQTLCIWRKPSKHIIVIKSLESTIESKKILTEVQDILITNSIFNVIILVPSLHLHIPCMSNDHIRDDIAILTVVPFPQYSCKGHLIILDVWHDNHFIYERNLFTDKFANFNGCVLPFSASNFLPYFAVTSKTNGNLEFHGVFGKLFKSLCKVMNFKPNVSVSRFRTYHGERLQNGSFTGILGEIYSGSTIANVRPSAAIQGYFEHFDFLFTLKAFSFRWIVPKPSLVPQWVILFYPYERLTWILICIACCSVVGLVKLISSLVEDKALRQTPILFMIAIILNVSVPRQPRILISRYIFILWVVSTYVLSSCYQASIVGFLSRPPTFERIKTMEELVMSELALGGALFIRDYFSHSNNPIMREISQRYIATDNLLSLYERSVRNKDIAVVSDVTVYEFIINSKSYFDSEGNSLLYILDGIISSFPIVLIFGKNSPYKGSFERRLVALLEVGFFEKWINDFLLSSRSIYSSHKMESTYVIRITNLVAPFAVLLFGFVVSFSLFIIELFMLKLKKK